MKPDRVSLGPALNHLLDARTLLGGEQGTRPAGLELPNPGQRGGSMAGVVVTGRPGSGKSTLALQTVSQAAKAGFDSLYLSLEDHPDVVRKKAQAFGIVDGTERSWEDFVYQPQDPIGARGELIDA